MKIFTALGPSVRSADSPQNMEGSLVARYHTFRNPNVFVRPLFPKCVAYAEYSGRSLGLRACTVGTLCTYSLDLMYSTLFNFERDIYNSRLRLWMDFCGLHTNNSRIRSTFSPCVLERQHPVCRRTLHVSINFFCHSRIDSLFYRDLRYFCWTSRWACSSDLISVNHAKQWAFFSPPKCPHFHISRFPVAK